MTLTRARICQYTARTHRVSFCVVVGKKKCTYLIGCQAQGMMVYAIRLAANCSELYPEQNHLPVLGLMRTIVSADSASATRFHQLSVPSRLIVRQHIIPTQSTLFLPVEEAVSRSSRPDPSFLFLSSSPSLVLRYWC